MSKNEAKIEKNQETVREGEGIERQSVVRQFRVVRLIVKLLY